MRETCSPPPKRWGTGLVLSGGDHWLAPEHAGLTGPVRGECASSTTGGVVEDDVARREAAVSRNESDTAPPPFWPIFRPAPVLNWGCVPVTRPRPVVRTPIRAMVVVDVAAIITPAKIELKVRRLDVQAAAFWNRNPWGCARAVGRNDRHDGHQSRSCENTTEHGACPDLDICGLGHFRALLLSAGSPAICIKPKPRTGLQLPPISVTLLYLHIHDKSTKFQQKYNTTTGVELMFCSVCQYIKEIVRRLLQLRDVGL